MLLPANLLGILFALTSAFIWGGADFSGGFATRRSNQFQVLALSGLSGMAILLVLVVLWQESLPSLSSAVWAILAGAAGALGLGAFYRALAMGYTAVVAPTAAVIGTLLPVGFSIFTEGLPGTARLVGFSLALVGIWLVSQSAGGQNAVSRRAFALACLAGVGFGGFFTLLAQVEPGKVFIPLMFARGATFCTALLMLRAYRLPVPAISSNPPALLAGVLDVGGNIFFLLAKNNTRLDVATILSSLYPAVTVLLARLVLNESASPAQWVGVAVCLAAIALVAI